MLRVDTHADTWANVALHLLLDLYPMTRTRIRDVCWIRLKSPLLGVYLTQFGADNLAKKGNTSKPTNSNYEGTLWL